MNQGSTIFAQLMSFLPKHEFDKSVQLIDSFNFSQILLLPIMVIIHGSRSPYNIHPPYIVGSKEISFPFFACLIDLARCSTLAFVLRRYAVSAKPL